MTKRCTHYSLQELTLCGAGVPHDTNIDVTSQTGTLDGLLGDSTKQHQQDTLLYLITSYYKGELLVAVRIIKLYTNHTYKHKIVGPFNCTKYLLIQCVGGRQRPHCPLLYVHSEILAVSWTKKVDKKFA